MIAEALASLLPVRATSRGPLDDFWYNPVAGPTPSGVSVSPEGSMRIGVVFACMRFLSEVIGSLPCITYQRTDRGKERAVRHPLYAVLHERPNIWQTPQEFWEMVVAHVNARGNFYGRITTGLSSVVQVVPLNPEPSRMKVEQLSDGTLRYHYKEPDGATRVFVQGEIFHVRGLSLDGFTGVSVIEYARNTIGSAIAMQEHGGAYFRNGGVPPFWIKRPAGLRWTPEAKQNFRAGWKGMHGGAENAHNPPILEDGMELVSLGMSNEDSQWLESSNATAEDICRFFRVQPHLVGLLARATFSNIEAQGIDTVRYTLAPWLNRIAQAAKRDLLPDDGYFIEFNTDALLRGDTLSRYQAHNLALTAGWKNRNEVRETENMNQVDGLDEYQTPLNMAPVGEEEQPTKKPTGDKDDEPKPPGAKTLSPMIRDAAARIVSSECQHIESQAGKRTRDELLEWAAAWYLKHASFVATTLRPIADTLRSDRDLDELAARLVKDWCGELHSRADVLALLAEWRRGKAQWLAEYLTEIL